MSAGTYRCLGYGVVPSVDFPDEGPGGAEAEAEGAINLGENRLCELGVETRKWQVSESGVVLLSKWR